MSRHSHVQAGRLDVSARAGVLLGAHASGSSYQPNLLTRGSRDQAIIAGVAASTAFGWGTVSHSFLRSLADRLPGATGSTGARVLSGVAVDALAAVAGAAGAAALRQRSGEPPRRSLLRLAATSTSASAVAGIGAELLDLAGTRRGSRLLTIAATVATWGASYAFTRSERARAGSQVDGGPAEEDISRQVSVPTAAAMGPAVTLAMIGLAAGESALSSLAARGAAAVLGGTVNDRRAAGRAVALAVVGGAGWAALRWVNGKLTHAGESLELAHADPPTLVEVTGGPGR